MLALTHHLEQAHGKPDALETLLMPSWLSGLVVVVASLAIVLGSLGLSFYHSSSVHLLLAQQHQAKLDATPDVASFDSNLTASNILSDLPLLVLWGGIGLIAYFFVTAIWGAFRSAAELRQEMDYVHASRDALIRTALQRLGLRLITLVIWVVYLNFTVHLFVPYAIAAGYAGASQLAWYRGLPFILEGNLLLAVCLHVHTVLLRLVMLRPRLFG